MKRVYHLLIAAVLFLTGAGQLNAQASLGLYTTSISDATPNMGDQLSILTNLVNLSSTDTFIGVVDFRMLHNGGEIIDQAIFGKPALAGTATIKVAPGEQKSLLFTVQIDAGYFVPGSDIIIVWPVAPVAIIDSAKTSIFINGTTGVNDLHLGGVSVFVANNQLMVVNPAQNTGVEQLQIFNLLGSPVLSYPVTKSTFAVPLANLPKGIYIAQLTGSNGERRAVKFVW